MQDYPVISVIIPVKNNYDTFIPTHSLKNYSSNTKKIKKIMRDYFWSSNLFINLNFKYKTYRANKKKNDSNYSAYFDTPIEKQKATIFFLDKYAKTMAEIDTEIKNKISHRAIALNKLSKFLESLK